MQIFVKVPCQAYKHVELAEPSKHPHAGFRVAAANLPNLIGYWLQSFQICRRRFGSGEQHNRHAIPADETIEVAAQPAEPIAVIPFPTAQIGSI